MTNLIDSYVNGSIGRETDESVWRQSLLNPPELMSQDERREWCSKLDAVSFASDAFLPFRDNVYRAVLSGVQFIACPSGSHNDQSIINACDEHRITMIHTRLRLFHH